MQHQMRIDQQEIYDRQLSEKYNKLINMDNDMETVQKVGC